MHQRAFEPFNTSFPPSQGGRVKFFVPIRTSKHRSHLHQHGNKQFEVQATQTSSASAKHSVEAGLQLYDKKDYQEALKNFLAAIQAEPRPEEAQAAYYNTACCHVKLKQWQEAADAVSKAVNEYSLDYKVAMEVYTPLCSVSKMSSLH